LFSRFVRVIGATLLAGCAAQPLVAATTWNQFRGPNGQGVAEDARPPVTFSPQKNVIWKAGVGQGHSSPVLWENRIFVTTFHDRELETVCLDRETGREIWRKAVTVERLQKAHEMSNAAASTPAVDKDRLYVYFGSYGVVCYDHDGKQLWQRNLPPAKNHYGGATSPILHDGHLILLLDADDGSSQLIALKQASGVTAWETPRPLFTAGWTTPMVWSNAHATKLLRSDRVVSRHTCGERQGALVGRRFSARNNSGAGGRRWNVVCRFRYAGRAGRPQLRCGPFVASNQRVRQKR
jgi:hypothetical protein